MKSYNGQVIVSQTILGYRNTPNGMATVARNVWSNGTVDYSEYGDHCKNHYDVCPRIDIPIEKLRDVISDTGEDKE